MKFFCLGDSLTFGYGVSSADRWTYVASKESSFELVNMGICGDTSGGILIRVRELLNKLSASTTERRYIFAMGGCNDILYSGTSAGAKENMGAVIHNLLSSGEIPIIGIPMPISDGNYPNQWINTADYNYASGLISEYGNWLYEFCNSFGVFSIDFRKDFIDDNGNTVKRLYLDGLHPSIEGHKKMAAHFCDAAHLIINADY